MKVLFRALLLLLVALPLLGVAAAVMCFQDRPLVARDVQLTAQDIEHAKRVVDAQDPRKAGPDGLQTVVIDGRDFDLALNYLASRLGHGAARATLGSGDARLEASFELPRSPFGRYVNIDATVRETGALPQLLHLKIGRLRVPAVLADWLMREGLRRLMATDRGQLAADVVAGVRIGEGRLTVTYRWSDDLARRARAVLVAPAEQARLRAYQERLAGAVARGPRTISLATLLPPLFQLALDRGAAGDVVAENRAAIVVLAFYANGKGLAEIVPAARQWPQPFRRTVTLAGRDDFPKHFLISAALAAEAGTPLADAIGVYKEVEDSRGGSGFSFNDIAADRAGTRFGEVASKSPERARQLARALASGVKESDFMPDVADLPEFIPEADFTRRYGGIGGSGYNRMMATIEARVAGRPLLQ
jgi:uncharacterized protein YfiM (DUF2279 family)